MAGDTASCGSGLSFRLQVLDVMINSSITDNRNDEKSYVKRRRNSVNIAW